MDFDLDLVLLLVLYRWPKSTVYLCTVRYKPNSAATATHVGDQQPVKSYLITYRDESGFKSETVEVQKRIYLGHCYSGVSLEFLG